MTNQKKPTRSARPAAGTTGTQPSGRRWPDLMIGALVLLLLGGFGTLLLRKDPAPAPVVAQTPPAIPSAPGSELPPPTAAPAEPVQPVPQTPAEPAPAPAEPAPATQPETPAPTPAEPAPAEPAPAEPTPAEAQPTPPATQPQPTTTITPPPAATPPPAEVPSATTLPETPAAPPAPSVPARDGGAVATSETRMPLRSDYRISLGSFATAATVRTRTASVAGLGYTVYPINVGNGFVAQVGPFADEATARAALTDIQRAYPGALMYPPRGVSASSGTTTPSTPTPAPSPTPAPAPTASADTPTYLQVGAFDRVESAQALVQQLRDLGYDPNVNAPEGRKVTVSVGPYTGDALTRTEARLSENGLDHFRVR